MPFSILHKDSYSEIQVVGSMVQDMCDAFADELDQMLDSNDLKSILLINLEDMDYISSSGLIPLINTFNRCNSQGISLGVYGLQPNIAHLFEVTGMSVYLRIFNKKEQALQALLPPA